MASLLRVIVLSWVFTLAWFTLWMLMPYLTNVWKLKFTEAAAVVNVFVGISAVGHLGMQLLVDTFLGDFWMLLLSCFALSTGFGFLSLSASPILSNISGGCNMYEFKCIGEGQKFLFYAALALISVGLFGHSVSLGAFMEDQIDENVNRNDAGTLRSFLIGNLGNLIFPLLAAIAVPDVDPWFKRFGIPAICEIVAMLGFLSGVCSYKREKPEGSPFMTVLRVFVASASKISYRCPDNSAQLYEISEFASDLKPHTSSLRCFDKAALVLPNQSLEQQRKNKWRLCRVTEVEETKSIIRVLPLFITSIISGIIFSLGNTFFLEQANHLNPKIGSWSLPLPVLLLLYEAARLGSRQLCLVAARRRSINPESSSSSRKNAYPFGIPISIILSTLCCMIAAHVETRRLDVVKHQGLVDKPFDTIPMSVFWLLPQYLLLGSITGIYENSFALYLEEVIPAQMSKYMVLLNVGVCGIGTMCSVLLVYVLGKVSGSRGKPSWFQDTLNKSCLDHYYWTLAVLSVVNLILYFLVIIWCKNFLELSRA